MDLTSSGNISQVMLAWNRSVNPKAVLATAGDTAVMYSEPLHSTDNVVYIHFKPETPVSSVNTYSKDAAFYKFSSPVRRFEYTIRLWGVGRKSDDKIYLKGGNYQLSVDADVAVA